MQKHEVAQMVAMKHKLNAADGVTVSRIVFAACVLFCPAFSAAFYVLYVLGAGTNVIDGWIARKRNLRSSFGAKLDAIADCVFVTAILAKVLPALYVPEWLRIWIAVIACMKLANLIWSLVIFRRIVPMHTVMNKVTGMMLFLLPFGIGNVPWQASAIAAIVACATATFAAIQEGHFIRAGKEIR